MEPNERIGDRNPKIETKQEGRIVRRILERAVPNFGAVYGSPKIRLKRNPVVAGEIPVMTERKARKIPH